MLLATDLRCKKGWHFSVRAWLSRSKLAADQTLSFATSFNHSRRLLFPRSRLPMINATGRYRCVCSIAEKDWRHLLRLFIFH
jgi:hypothetical protein